MTKPTIYRRSPEEIERIDNLVKSALHLDVDQEGPLG
jgi:hypothetical protein